MYKSLCQRTNDEAQIAVYHVISLFYFRYVETTMYTCMQCIQCIFDYAVYDAGVYRQVWLLPMGICL